MNLIVVESPTKARTLSKFLGKDYVIEASMGHVRDLPVSKLGIDVDKNFALDYVVADKKKATVAELKKLAKQADSVILATDPDREGEAISWHIASLISEQSKKVAEKIKRISFHEITESAIADALVHPRTIDMNLVDAQQSRRVLDRLVGYKLSPLLWKKVRRGLSAGRVQSVAVRLIVERDREILAFKADEYWEIIGRFAVSEVHSGEGTTVNSEPSSAANLFEARLTKINDAVAKIENKEQADKIVAELNTAKYQIINVSVKEAKRNPYPPFTTSTLQQVASNQFGWSAKRTMQVAQNLYEQGLITYHRTDSTNLAVEALTKVREMIAADYGKQYLPSEPKLYKTKSKVAQEAHEAIRPTKMEQINSMEVGQDRDQHRLYELIWKRFVACQMVEAVFEQTSVDISTMFTANEVHSGEGTTVNSEPSSTNNTFIFRANGNRQLFDGWLRVMNNEKIINPDEEEDKVQALPKLTNGDNLNLNSLLPSQHFTQPPPRFNEASLIKTLEEYGIGRPSTYAPIISTIQERQYVEKTEKKFHPTALGMAVNDFLFANFGNILDYKFTALMEDSLDEIANGEKQWIPLMKEFYEPFARQLTSVGETAQRVKVETEETDEICPNDGSPLVVRIGKFGKFLACSKFPECKFTKTFSVKTNIKCPQCGGEIIIKRTRNKKTFYGCSNYPTCKFASWNKPKVGENGVMETPAVPEKPSNPVTH